MRRFFRGFADSSKTKVVRTLYSKSQFCPCKERYDNSLKTGLRFRPKILWDGSSHRNLFSLSANNYGYISMSGRNKENEDYYNLVELKPGVKYFGVFDGHCGKFVGEFVNKKLPQVIKEEIDSFKISNFDDYEINGENMLISAFEKCQSYLKESINSQDFDKKKKESLGSTALMALIINESKLFISHVGDSRAVLCKSGSPICLTDDHTPDNEQEVDRITECGGWIDWDTKIIPYVNGILSMTRSFGNFGLRNAGIIHTPYISITDLDHTNDEFLILCTDGVSNWINDEDIVSLVSQYQNPQEAAHALISCARQYGSNDDATAVVIQLGAWTNIMHSKFDSTNHLLRANFTRRY